MTDRYVVNPVQACSYPIGQIKILELRDRARNQLGDKFDIKHFRDQIIGGGARPMS